MRTRQMGLLSIVLVLLAGCGSTPVVPTAVVAVDTVVPPTAVPSIAVLPTPAPTLPPVAGQVVDVINNVDAHPLPVGAWEDALVEMRIYLGGEVWAQEASTARVQVADQLIRVAPNTIFSCGRPDPNTVQIDLQDGQMWLNVEGQDPGMTFEIQTPDAVAAVRGTRFSVRTLAEGGTLVSTSGGTVTLAAAGTVVSVTTGQQSTVPAGAPPTAPVTMTLEEQMRWGNAAGAGLDVVFPAIQSIAMFTRAGSVHGSLSPDGRFFLASYYLSKEGQIYESGNLTYDVAAGEVVSDVTPAQASCRAYSPDGQWIAYNSPGAQGSQMCFIPATGGTAACVGTAQVVSGCPYWSPDSQWVAFYRFDLAVGETSFNLYKVRPDGSELTPLTSGQENAKVAPDWSPDSTQIAYMVRPAPPGDGSVPRGELWVMDADGSNARLLQDNLYGYTHPYWNPDGRTLLVRGYEDGESSGMWLVPAAGGPAERVPGTETGGFYGEWSPSPSGWPLLLPVYVGDTGRRTVYYANSDGGPLQTFAALDWGPIWSADRQTAAFGDLGGAGEDEVTTVYFMRLVPGFYP
jgi:uncharacterized protein YceK